MKNSICVCVLLFVIPIWAQNTERNHLVEFFGDHLPKVNKELKEYMEFKISNQFRLEEVSGDKLSKLERIDTVNVCGPAGLEAFKAEDFIEKWERNEINPLFIQLRSTLSKLYRIGNTRFVLFVKSEEELLKSYKSNK